MIRSRFTLPTLALIACSVSARAQVGSGTLTGTVQDSTGATVANAQIVLKETANQTSQTVKSNGSGFFTFQNLQAGTYSATVTAPGFNTIVRNNIQLHIGDQLNLPALKLKPAADASSITVTTEEQIAPPPPASSPTPLPRSRLKSSTSRAAAPSSCWNSSPEPPTPATSTPAPTRHP